MERVEWTDDRLDERFAAIDRTFERIFEELRLIREDIAGVNARLDGLQDRLAQIGFAMAGVLAVALFSSLTALVVALG